MRLEEIGKRYIQIQKRKAKLIEEEIALKSSMDAILGEFEAKELMFGNVQVVKVTPKPANRFDAKAFQETHPRIYKKFVKTGKATKPYLRVMRSAMFLHTAPILMMLE